MKVITIHKKRILSKVIVVKQSKSIYEFNLINFFSNLFFILAKSRLWIHFAKMDSEMKLTIWSNNLILV